MLHQHQLSAVLHAYKNIQKLAHFYLRTIALVTFLVAVPQRGYAVDWVPISGKIAFEGAPLCALVLANGQHMFSCRGNGNYNLTVPLDKNGTITLFTFVSGFAPFKQVLTAGEAAIYNVGIARSATARELEVTHKITPAVRANWVNISGTVLDNGLPVCAMALANGQQMFTCGNNLGRFSMDVPLDSKGEVTLFNFASGFSPSKKSISGNTNTGNLHNIDDAFVGTWKGFLNVGEIIVTLTQDSAFGNNVTAGCPANLLLLQSSGNVVVYEVDVLSGPCIPGILLELTLTSESIIRLDMYLPGPLDSISEVTRIGSGVLTKQ